MFKKPHSIKENRHPYRQAGFSMIETIVAIGLLGIMVVILSSSMTMQTKGVLRNEARLNFELLTARLYNVFQNNAVCETTNIVTKPTMTTAIGFSQTPIRSFTDLKISGQKIASIGFDKETRAHITKLELWQKTPPMNPPVVPQRFFGDFRVTIKADPNGQSTRTVSRNIPIMLITDTTGRITSCFTEISLRIPCEDLGWIYYPTETPDCRPQ